MKILCLHGVGSNAHILQDQLRAFLTASDPSYEYVFLDGPYPCEKGPGLGDDLDGPFFSHTLGYEPENMRSALEHLELALKQHGPFDGVLGFSQGAAVTLSYLHHCQTTGKLPGIQFAVCLSSVLPCSSDSDMADGLIQRICPIDESSSNAGSREQELFVDLLKRTIVPALENNCMFPRCDVGLYYQKTSEEAVASAPRLLHPDLVGPPISIPTVHISGKRDAPFMRNMSHAALGLCERKRVKVLEHGDGHTPPQKAADVKAAVRAMEWAISLAHRIAQL